MNDPPRARNVLAPPLLAAHTCQLPKFSFCDSDKNILKLGYKRQKQLRMKRRLMTPMTSVDVMMSDDIISNCETPILPINSNTS